MMIGRRQWLLLAALTALSMQAQEDPLEPIASAMNAAAAGLNHPDVGAATQKSEQSAVTQLKTLIEQVEQQLKQQQQQQGQGGRPPANPTEGMKESRVVDGPGGRGQMIRAREGANDWGKLPDRDRDKIIQAREQGFPAGYEEMLERYYKRLAEEKSGGEAKQP